VAVNQSPHQSQCFLGLPFRDLAARPWRLRGELGTASYDRDGSDLERRGLYLDVPAWQASVFSLAGEARKTAEDFTPSLVGAMG
jgi:hypothetical protein